MFYQKKGFHKKIIDSKKYVSNLKNHTRGGQHFFLFYTKEIQIYFPLTRYTMSKICNYYTIFFLWQFVQNFDCHRYFVCVQLYNRYLTAFILYFNIPIT